MIMGRPRRTRFSAIEDDDFGLHSQPPETGGARGAAGNPADKQNPFSHANLRSEQFIFQWPAARWRAFGIRSTG
jgi:hypothetical protein